MKRFEIFFSGGLYAGKRVGEADVVRLTNTVIHTNNRPMAVGSIQAVWGLVVDPALELTRMVLYEVGINKPFTTLRNARRGRFLARDKELALCHETGILPFASVLQLEEDGFVYSLHKKNIK
jgi:hypothetical protein